MTDLQALADEYLATRRALGASLDESGRILLAFVKFLARQREAFVTTRRALERATKPAGAGAARRARRLAAVRAFARCASAADPRHEVPPEGLLPARSRRATPLHLQ